MKNYREYIVVSNLTNRMVGVLRKHRLDRAALKFNGAKMAVITDKGSIVRIIDVRLSSSKARLDQFRNANVPYNMVSVSINTSSDIKADYLTSLHNRDNAELI